MDQLLAHLADVGGPAFLFVLALRYFPQFEEMLNLARRYASEGSLRLQIFASRTVVIATRKIWWVILPVMFAATAVSTISAWQIEGFGGWFAANLTLKLIALAASIVMAAVASRVQHIPDGEDNADGRFGRSWLYVPMIATAMFSLVTLTGATLSDTFLLADRVSYFNSVFSAIVFSAMLVFTLGFVFAGLATLYGLALIGIDAGGAGWNGVVAQAITKLVIGLTSQNNQVIMFSPEARKSAGETARALLYDHRFIGGVVAAWILWFLAFQGPVAWLVELVIIIALVCVLGTVWWITRLELTGWRNGITVTVATLGLIAVFLRLIDAAVPGEHPVMFYSRIESLFAGLGSAGGLTCYAVGIPKEALVFTGAIAVIFVWLASRTSGRRSQLLFLVAALIGLPLAGVSVYRLTAPQSADANRVSCGYIEAAPAAPPTGTPAVPTVDPTAGASPSSTAASFLPTVVAGTHSPQHACSLSDPSRPCSH